MSFLCMNFLEESVVIHDEFISRPKLVSHRFYLVICVMSI